MSLPNDLLELFTSEFNKLENLVNGMNFDVELPVNQIVEVYYQITNISSMITVVKPQLDQNNTTILYVEKFISEKFNSIIHPKIMEHIVNSISSITHNLQSINSEQKSKETIESEAKLYEKLREMMSTREFVKQYDAGLSND
jgi:large-conductance mechanosensitive channel